MLHVVLLTSFHCDITTVQPLDGPFYCDVTMKKSAIRCDVGPLARGQLTALEIAKIGRSEKLTHLARVILAKIAQCENIPIYGMFFSKFLHCPLLVQQWVPWQRPLTHEFSDAG